MGSVSTDPDWRCGCHQTNPDCEDRCCNCGQERYPDSGEEVRDEPGIYAMETERMIQAQELK